MYLNSKDDGGPAFPIPHQVIDANDELFKHGSRGMTLRDWFAGQALAGMNANKMFNDESWAGTAEQAYLAADAMIKARGQ